MKQAVRPATEWHTLNNYYYLDSMQHSSTIQVSVVLYVLHVSYAIMYLYSLAFIYSPPELNMLLRRFDEFQHFEFSFLTRSFFWGGLWFNMFVCVCHTMRD